MKYFVLGFLTALIVAASVAIGFFICQQSTSPVVHSEPAPLAYELTLSPTPIEPAADNTLILKDTVLNALNLRNYRDLIPSMTDEVWVRLENTSCCAQASSTNSINNLLSLNNARLPWVFAEGGEFDNIVAIYPEHYKNALIYVSENDHLAAFQLDSENKIYKISISTNYNILLP
jgi:hypothetical protein